MLTTSDIEDYHNHLEQHEDYIFLMGNYSHTEIYKEIIHFMDIAFPEWTSNNGIGFWAAEFVLSAIQNLEHLYGESNFSTFEVLKQLYLNLVDDYESFKSEFYFVIKDAIINNFEIEYNDLLDENEHLPENDFRAFYDALYNPYKVKVLNKITYNFT